MTDTGGAVAPYDGGVLSGVVSAPAANPDSHSIHRAFAVIHKLVDHSTGYVDEASQLAAHRALDAMKHVLIPKEDHHKVVQETDPAPVEDVSQRRAPGAPVAVPAAGPIDYHLLAEAIVAVQRSQAAAVEAAGEVHVITDAGNGPAIAQ